VCLRLRVYMYSGAEAPEVRGVSERKWARDSAVSCWSLAVSARFLSTSAGLMLDCCRLLRTRVPSESLGHADLSHVRERDCLAI
jgi:hypothetical protein